MMARSTTRSNQRPDTLMQDRSPPARQNPLATHGRTIHWVKRCVADQGRRSYLSVVGPIGDKMVRRGECSEVPKADIRDCLLTKPNRIRRAGVCILLGIGLNLHREREARQRD